MFFPYPAYWYVCCGRPRLGAARLAMLAKAGTPIGPGLGGVGAGPGFIEPALGFFAHGNPVGGPTEAFRGVAAASFPASAVILGPGAPLAPESTGLAGSPLSTAVGIHGGPIP